ncbi:MAG TPA: FAD-dependent oxidoreductase [Gemmatimonadota bacterium]|nr:FAD-dependent oxidoreductase [Gemmatimonadota bacterium]
MTTGRRMAILGGGPVGLECLLRAVREGWEATLFERGRVGENVRGWGHVRMFSPLEMNLSEAARAVARDTCAWTPGSEELLTGNEYVARHLEPLAGSRELAGRVRTGTEVLAVSRGGLRKGDEIATPARGRRPFWILVRDDRGERVESAEIVIDATGTFGSPNWLGPGGIPAIGETLAATAIEYRLPDITGSDRDRFAGRHTAVIGAGHSAATAIGWLGEVAAAWAGTTVTWVTRSSDKQPVAEIAGDPLPERERVTRLANDAAGRAPGWLEREVGASVLAVSGDGGRHRLRVANGGNPRELVADRVLALVGYRPDLGLARELQVQTCWATEGTYPLAAALLSQTGGTADCLTAGANLDAATLKHPEGGFYTLGMKSYGRNPNFLIRAGLKQIDDLFALLGSA